jgi:catechol 2,3-dioxygenase-like lactoylglutathione lyase family enzyme
MKIWLTKVYVGDQAKAHGFYTDVLGFVKKADFKNGNYRWLTVASPDDRNGAQLQLEANQHPAAKAIQTTLHQQGIPAANV